MTTEQYLKRLQFIELVKINYIPIPGYQLIFYFEDYDISTITDAEYSPTGSITRQYYSDRQNNECGGLVLTHDYNAHIIIHLFDKNCSIIYDITKNCIVENDLKMPLDMRQLKKELQQLYLVLKGQ